MIPTKWRVVPLLAWTFTLWVSRSRTVLLNDQLNGAEVAWRLLAAAIFLTLASVVLFHMMRGANSRTWLRLLVIWSIGFWIIRGGGILFDSQRTLGFKTVHTLLMFGTFALAAISVSGKRN